MVVNRSHEVGGRSAVCLVLFEGVGVHHLSQELLQLGTPIGGVGHCCDELALGRSMPVISTLPDNP